MSDSRSIDIQLFLNTNRFSTFQWTVFALCFSIVLLDGFDTAAIGFIAPSLVGEWGVPRSALAPVLSAALFGLAAGALFTGPLADRFGRKLVLIFSVLVFGLASLGSAFSTDLTMLTVFRFVTGLGLGAAMPNAVTLMNEFCPDKRRATLTNAMFCGFPLGAALGGFLAAWMIPLWGWRSVLQLGGIAPLILAVLLVGFLPESIRYMVANQRSVEQIRAVLMRISNSVKDAASFTMSEPGGVRKGQSGPVIVVSGSYIVGSLMLWIAYFMGLVIFYALINWMPILFRDAGIVPRTATLISALFPLGGVGAILFGWFMDRYNGNWIIAIGYGLTAIFIYAIGQSVGTIALLMVIVFIAGTLMNTAQSSMPALAASFYPTQGRATGVAWMLGVGRFGGIAGSYLVAELSRRQLTFAEIFMVVAIPGVIAAIALVIKQFVHPEKRIIGLASVARTLAH
jgi:AAHS family 4-hydroxybenzoate transporter-like MFS transporter